MPIYVAQNYCLPMPIYVPHIHFIKRFLCASDGNEPVQLDVDFLSPLMSDEFDDQIKTGLLLAGEEFMDFYPDRVNDVRSLKHGVRSVKFQESDFIGLLEHFFSADQHQMHLVDKVAELVESYRPEFGWLAKTYCGKELPLRVLRPNTTSDFYIGTWDPEEGPFSRESVEYFRTQESAEAALKSGNWTQRDHP